MASFSRTLAVDMGASAVRLLEVGPDSKGRPTILALSEEEIPFDPAKTSDFLPLYTQALTAALGRLPSKTRQCHLCLGGPAVFARILKVPAGEPKKVAAMIGFEAQQTVPAIEQALWEYQIMPSAQASEVEALIFAIKKETVEEATAAAFSAGLRPQSVTLAPAALLDGFLYNYPETTGCNLILEIGSRATTILLVEGSRLFIRVVPLGGGSITQAVVTDLQESFAGAETLKKAKGFVHPGGAYEDPPDAATARISKLARGVMTRLHAEVERSITFFRSQQGGGKPAQAWVTGGGAQMGYVDLFFRDKLRIPVQFFQPFRRLALPATAEAQNAAQNFPRWAQAVGTACHALPTAPVKIDVFGAIAKSQNPKNRNTPALVIGAVAAGALILLPGVHGFWQSVKIGQRLAVETQRVEEAGRILEKLEKENKKFLATTQRVEIALGLEQERLKWPGLFEEFKKQVPPKLWITSLRVLPPAEGAGSPASPGKPAISKAPLVEIEGMFETQSKEADAEAVAKFQKALEAGGLLKNVTVLEREAPLYVEGKTDQVALKFRLQAEWSAGEKDAPKAPGKAP